ncbi:MAG: hypothetical protein ACH0QD_08555 [Tepidibacillus sp.]
MKKFKFLALALVFVFLLVFLYQNYIYYKIPYNPITKYSSENLSSFHITKNLPNGEEVSAKTNDLDTSNLILRYFRDLKLMPLKDKSALDVISKQGNETYFTVMLEFNQSERLFIKDIFLENLRVLYISSDFSGFHEGYYRIIGSKFDYNYIYDLISNSEK